MGAADDRRKAAIFLGVSLRISRKGPWLREKRRKAPKCAPRVAATNGETPSRFFTSPRPGVVCEQQKKRRGPNPRLSNPAQISDTYPSPSRFVPAIPTFSG